MFARARQILPYAFMAVAVALLVAAVVREWEGFSAAVGSMRPSTVAASAAIGALALASSMASWRDAMAAPSARLPVGPAAHTYFVSQLGKYIPGSVWPVLAQMELMRTYGVSRAQSAVGSLLGMIVGLATAIVVGFSSTMLSGGSAAGYWWLLPAALVCLVVLVPPVLRFVLKRAARLGGRFSAFQEVYVRGDAIVRSAIWSAASWILWGTLTWLLLRPVADRTDGLWFLCVGAFALSWAVGFVVVFAPGGIGPREVALVAILGASAGTTDALAVALVSRVLTTLLDLLGAGLAVALWRLTGHAHRRPA
jgi:glycosyltransferase 2 family protein